MYMCKQCEIGLETFLRGGNPEGESSFLSDDEELLPRNAGGVFIKNRELAAEAGHSRNRPGP